MLNIFTHIKSFFTPGSKKRRIDPIELLNSIDEEANAPWWGPFTLNDEQSRFWKIGRVILCIDKVQQEYKIASYYEDQKPIKNFTTVVKSKDWQINPALPSKALITLLQNPIFLPAGEETQLYVSVPAVIKLSFNKPSISVDEIETQVLSETWIGTNTQEGQVCYSNSSACVTNLNDLVQDNSLIICPAIIKNRSKETVTLKQLYIPLPLLSIYSDAQNLLWTEPVQITYTHSNDYPDTNIGKGPLNTLQRTTLLTPSRLDISAGIGILNFLNSLLRKP